MIADSSKDIEQKLNPQNSLDELRRQAMIKIPIEVPKREITKIVPLRSQAIKEYTIARAKGYCEGCKKPAPFRTKKGPFLETHHVNRISDGGPDHPEFVIALCPNCHREVHYGTKGEEYNLKLIQILKILENKSLV